MKVDLKIQIRTHEGWTSVFHKDFELETTGNAHSFYGALRKAIENEFDADRAIYPGLTMKYMKDRNYVLKCTAYKRCTRSGETNESTIHIVVSNTSYKWITESNRLGAMILGM